MESESVYGRTKKRIGEFEWSNQELVGFCVEPMMRATANLRVVWWLWFVVVKLESTMAEVESIIRAVEISGTVNLRVVWWLWFVGRENLRVRRERVVGNSVRGAEGERA